MRAVFVFSPLSQSQHCCRNVVIGDVTYLNVILFRIISQPGTRKKESVQAYIHILKMNWSVLWGLATLSRIVVSSSAGSSRFHSKETGKNDRISFLFMSIVPLSASKSFCCHCKCFSILYCVEIRTRETLHREGRGCAK